MAGVFINYRTGNGDKEATLVDEALRREFGDEMVFRDHRAIGRGADYRVELLQNLERCSVLLVLMGSDWLTQADSSGHRRIDDPADWVRMEIASMLAWRRKVIPLLLNDAPLPEPRELPYEIAELPNRQAMYLRTKHADQDLPLILDEVRKEVPGRRRHDGEGRTSGGTTLKNPKRNAIALGSGDAEYFEGRNREE
ncbi:toll/interleukin-1 receptor domain-containing protein [Streptomyces sp. So13.3]|uniref:TIR domain-containing protein n=1 Tax=Streptomyces sp. So13.3 TaxID=2136173 RepID=UPI00164E7888|nr:TIR domain-containing protein [Streptomyces sp. So13.3]QNA75412.1 toll/interleukin-1 receptor domain-containing protein [Streptomyces sp. So13.3]